jgi:hypothetical protein
MMARVQVSLSPEEHRRARARAADLGVSFAEYVRRLVARDLGEVRTTGGLDRLFDLGDSGDSDVEQHKHRYVGDAVASAR